MKWYQKTGKLILAEPPGWQPILGIFQDVWHALGDRADPLGHDDAELGG